MSNRVFCLMGPTASGKTALACELIRYFPFEIISVDSAMIYREMDIGTAKPTPAELALAPHHLINIINPNESYSAAQFCDDVKKLCGSIFERGKIPLLVGGTMMYFNALQNGLSALPEADESLRKQLEQDVQRDGLESLYQKLIRIDPLTASRLHAHDAQRIQRALEVYYITGRSLSEFLSREKIIPDFQFINVALFPTRRAWLHERIAIRFDQMLSEGLIEEVQKLRINWNLQLTFPSMRCVGYRQVLGYLRGDDDYQIMREKGIAATRQLAKRQLTWLRHWSDCNYFDPELAFCAEKIVDSVQQWLP